MPTRTRLPVLSVDERAALLARYDTAPDPETRTRFQMLLLATDHDLSTHQIAPLVQRCHDVVLRVFQRYLAGGPDAVPHRKAPGRQPAINAAWEAHLLRVIEDDPHGHGVDSANWTTQLLADYLESQTEIRVNQETVRRHLHRLGYVCKRPTWTMAPKAAEREDWGGNGCGWRSS